MGIIADLLLALLAVWALCFVLTIPILAALMRSSQLSKDEEAARPVTARSTSGRTRVHPSTARQLSSPGRVNHRSNQIATPPHRA